MSMSRLLSKVEWETTVVTLVNPVAIWKIKPVTFRLNDNLVIIFSHFWNSIVLRKILLADIVQFEYPFLLPLMVLVRILGKPVVLDEHGVEAVFIRELKKIPKESAKNFSTGFLLRSTPGLGPIILAVEKMAVKIASVVFACSSSDAAEIRRLYHVDEEKVKVVPNCADPTFFEDVVPHNFGRPAVLFLGSFDHLPNLQGASILLRSIVPIVREQVNDALFILVGKNPPQWLVDQSMDGVLFTGEVEDIRPLVLGANVTIAPIFSGSGTRQKIVDYMALGKAIVSTTKGAEGIDLEDGIHFLRRDDLNGFSEAIVQLLRDKHRAELLGKRVREIAREKYAWDSQISNILQAYAIAMAGK